MLTSSGDYLFDALTDSVVEAICACLDPIDLERMLLVSKTWRRIGLEHVQSVQLHVRAIDVNQGSITRLRQRMTSFKALRKVVLKLPTHLSTKTYGRAEHEALGRTLDELSRGKHVVEVVLKQTNNRLNYALWSILDRDADLGLLRVLPSLSALSLSFSLRPPHLQQLASLTGLRSLDLAGDSAGLPDRYVAALSCLSTLSQLTKLGVRVFKMGSSSGSFQSEVEHPDDARYATVFNRVVSNQRHVVVQEEKAVTALVLRCLSGLRGLRELTLHGVRPGPEAVALACRVFPRLERFDAQRRAVYSYARTLPHLTSAEWRRQPDGRMAPTAAAYRHSQHSAEGAGLNLGVPNNWALDGAAGQIEQLLNLIPNMGGNLQGVLNAQQVGLIMHPAMGGPPGVAGPGAGAGAGGAVAGAAANAAGGGGGDAAGNGNGNGNNPGAGLAAGAGAGGLAAGAAAGAGAAQPPGQPHAPGNQGGPGGAGAPLGLGPGPGLPPPDAGGAGAPPVGVGGGPAPVAAGPFGGGFGGPPPGGLFAGIFNMLQNLVGGVAAGGMGPPLPDGGGPPNQGPGQNPAPAQAGAQQPAVAAGGGAAGAGAAGGQGAAGGGQGGVVGAPAAGMVGPGAGPGPQAQAAAAGVFMLGPGAGGPPPGAGFVQFFPPMPGPPGAGFGGNPFGAGMPGGFVIDIPVMGGGPMNMGQAMQLGEQLAVALQMNAHQVAAQAAANMQAVAHAEAVVANAELAAANAQAAVAAIQAQLNQAEAMLGQAGGHAEQDEHGEDDEGPPALMSDSSDEEDLGDEEAEAMYALGEEEHDLYDLGVGPGLDPPMNEAEWQALGAGPHFPHPGLAPPVLPAPVAGGQQPGPAVAPGGGGPAGALPAQAGPQAAEVPQAVAGLAAAAAVGPPANVIAGAAGIPPPAPVAAAPGGAAGPGPGAVALGGGGVMGAAVAANHPLNNLFAANGPFPFFFEEPPGPPLGMQIGQGGVWFPVGPDGEGEHDADIAIIEDEELDDGPPGLMGAEDVDVGAGGNIAMDVVNAALNGVANAMDVAGDAAGGALALPDLPPPILPAPGAPGGGGAGVQPAPILPLIQALQAELAHAPLSSLQSLSLVTQMREFVPEVQLAGLAAAQQLTSLRLTAEGTGRAPPQDPLATAQVLGIVSGLPRLASLELGGTHLRLEAGALTPAAAALALHGLTRLVFEGRFGLKASDTDVFRGLTSLRHLELKQARADPFMFRPKLSLMWLPLASLEHLDLKQIEVLAPRVPGFPRLLRLLMRDCSVHSLEAFGACPVLTTFEHNQLSNFRRDNATGRVDILQPLVRLWPRLAHVRINFFIPYETLTPEAVAEQFVALATLRELRALTVTAYCRNSGRAYARMHEGLHALSSLRCLRSLALSPVSAAAVSELGGLTRLAHLRLDSVPAHALLELTELQALQTLQYSEDTGRWAYDPTTIRMDPVALHVGLAAALPHTLVIDGKGLTPGYGRGFLH